MNTPLSFTVTFTGCLNDCPYKRILRQSYGVCTKVNAEEIDDHEIYQQNKHALTNSCPMLSEKNKEK